MPTPRGDEIQATLERIWLAQAKALAEILESTPPSELQAATLNVARQFLSDNSIRADTLAPGRAVATNLEALAAAIMTRAATLPGLEEDTGAPSDGRSGD